MARLTDAQRKAITRSKTPINATAKRLGVSRHAVWYWRQPAEERSKRNRRAFQGKDRSANTPTYVLPSTTLIVGTTRREGLQSIDNAEMWDAVHELDCGCLPQEGCAHVVESRP